MAETKPLTQAVKNLKKAGEGDNPKKLLECCGDFCHSLAAHGKPATPGAPVKAGAAKEPTLEELEDCCSCLEECKETFTEVEVKDNKKVGGILGGGAIWKLLGPIALEFAINALKELINGKKSTAGEGSA